MRAVDWACEAAVPWQDVTSICWGFWDWHMQDHRHSFCHKAAKPFTHVVEQVRDNHKTVPSKAAVTLSEASWKP